jgi:DNA replication and repair protein RecF
MGSIIYKHLDTIIAREIDSKRILFGPHRDDMVISYGPGPARNFASRGEAKSLALSLKLIEADILLKISGTAPVVVLDDAFSELDLKRRERLFDAFPSGCQIIVTMPDKSLVPESLKYNKAFYSVENGVVNKL